VIRDGSAPAKDAGNSGIHSKERTMSDNNAVVQLAYEAFDRGDAGERPSTLYG
jgi:hypothetical protein